MFDLRRCGIGTKAIVYALIICLNVLYMPAMAPAAPKGNAPTIYVFSFSPDGEDTPLELLGMSESKFKDDFKSESRIRMLTTKEVLTKLKGKPRGPASVGIDGEEKLYKRAKKYLNMAKEAFSDGEMEDVQRSARKAITYFKKSPNHIKNFDDVKSAYLYLAAGNEAVDEDGSKELMTVLAFDPGYQPGGDLGNVLKRSVKKAGQAPKKGSLSIDTDPEDATVLINGKEFKAPVREKNLIAGDYYIRVSGADAKPYDDVVTISGAEKQLTVTLGGGAPAGEAGVDKLSVFKSLNDKVRTQSFDKAFFSDAQRFGNWIGADYLVIGAYQTEKTSSTLFALVFDVKAKQLGQASKVAVENDGTDAEDSIDIAYTDTKRAILKDFPEKVLPPGAVLVAGGASAPVAAAAEPEAEPEPEPEYEPEPEPEPMPVAAAPLNLDVDKSIYFSDEDKSNATQIGEEEESIAPVEKTPIYKEWWLWTIVGVVVVGGAVTAGILLQPSDESATSKVEFK